ncbi:SIP domain-containing protein, partial [Microbacterium oxydans]|nr:SIP domain-containing protein [Microbacterium oxydans]
MRLDIDFVVHEAGARRSRAARAAGSRPRAELPTGPVLAAGGITWRVLVADLTGLPAVARIIAEAPRGVRTRVVLECRASRTRIGLEAGADVEVTRVVGGNGHGPSASARSCAASSTTGSPSMRATWVAGRDRGAARRAQGICARELGLPATRFKVVGYWTPVAAWEEKFAALPESVQKEVGTRSGPMPRTTSRRTCRCVSRSAWIDRSCDDGISADARPRR